MKKVSFLKSIHLKFVIIYALLIIIAMQIIGVYFVGKLENQLISNFKSSIEGRIPLLEYNIREEMNKDRTQEGMRSLEEEIYELLVDFSAADIAEVRIMNNRSIIIGSSDITNQDIIGQKLTNLMIQRTLQGGSREERMEFDNGLGRIWVLTTPIKMNDEVIGAIYLVAKIENVYEQMD